MIRVLEAIDWAWIGYALFHPDGKTSAWRQLPISVDGSIHKDALRMLRLMAVGIQRLCISCDR